MRTKLAALALAAPLLLSPAFAGNTIPSGFYAGIVGTGAMFTNTQEDHWCDYACDAPTASGFDAAIGGTAGFNWVEGNALIGVEADISTGFSNEVTVLYDVPPGADGMQWNADWDWLATVRARAGLTQGNTVVYATAGVAFAGVNYEAAEIRNDVKTACDPTDTFDCASYSDTEVGIALGAGVEIAVSPGMTAKLEYMYVGMPDAKGFYDDQNSPDEFVNWTSEAHMARIGVNFALN
jgi:opacity protein-like surface antigen